ncbi:hypothetical protein T439DRAFT_360360 [Meredithblackwellia eburnea MCA 4105]
MAPHTSESSPQRDSCSQISVHIVTTTTSTYTPFPPSPAASSPNPHSIQGPALPPTSPPPYSSGTQLPLEPLSFYPSTSHTSSNDTQLPFSPAGLGGGTPSPPGTTDELPPSYRSTPRCLAERFFFWGFLCPFLWILGILKLWYPEPIIGKGKHAPSPLPPVTGIAEDVEMGGVDVEGLTSGNVRLTVALWREEERVWAARCGYCLFGFVTLAAVFATAIASVLKGHSGP